MFSDQREVAGDKSSLWLHAPAILYENLPNNRIGVDTPSEKFLSTHDLYIIRDVILLSFLFTVL